MIYLLNKIINTFIQQGCIKLIKSVQKIIKQYYSFQYW